MTNKEAFEILKCDELNDVQDAYEVALFAFKPKFLQQIPPIKITRAIQKKIERVNSAYYFFYPSSNSETIEVEDILLADLGSFLENHQLILSQLRLKITNSSNGESLLNLTSEFINHQIKLFIKLSTYLKNDKIDLDNYPIKLSEEINIYKLQVELKALQIGDTQISEYIRNQIENLNFEEFAYITQVVMNAEKQIIFNELRIRG